MAPLRVDDVRALLPPLEELRPLLGRVLATSGADPERRWSAAGELETLGERLARPGRVEEALPELLDGVREHLSGIYTAVLAALDALESGDAAAAGAGLLRAADLEESAGRMDRAEAYALAAHRAVEGLRDRTPAAVALRRAARAARAAGRLDDAARRYEAAHRTARAAGDEENAVVAAIGRGNVAVDRGGWEEAGRWYRWALERLDAGEAPRRERWQVCQNLSIVARRVGDLEAARTWLERADSEASALGDDAAAAEIGNGWGMLAMARGEPAEAERRFRAARAVATGASARVAVSVNLAEALLAQGRSLEAAETAREAEREALIGGIVTRLPEVYRLLGRVAAARGHRDAFVFFERALDVTDSWALPAWERAATQEAYAQLEAERGEADAARARLREAVELYGRAGSAALQRAAREKLDAMNGDDHDEG